MFFSSFWVEQIFEVRAAGQFCSGIRALTEEECESAALSLGYIWLAKGDWQDSGSFSGCQILTNQNNKVVFNQWDQIVANPTTIHLSICKTSGNYKYIFFYYHLISGACQRFSFWELWTFCSTFIREN